MACFGSEFGRITEDEVEEPVRAHLTARGFDIEAKAEPARTGLSRATTSSGCSVSWSSAWNDARAFYGIALPNKRQYPGLVDRLRALAKERLILVVFWVSRKGEGLFVAFDS